MDESCETKLKLVFRELLKSDYKVTDDTMLEKLLTHLSSKGDDGIPKLKNFTASAEWVRCALQLWRDGKLEVPIMSFALRLMGILFEDEEHFRYVYTAVGGLEFFQHLLEVLQLKTNRPPNFSIKCAHISMLSSILLHPCGRRWILLSRVWVEVLQLCRKDPSIYVVREGRKFLSSLLNRMPASQAAEAEEVMAHILDPLITFPQCEGESLSPEAEKTLRSIVPTLQIIYEILSKSFLSVDPETNKPLSVVVSLVFRPRFDLMSRVTGILKMGEEEEALELLSKIITLLHILDLITELNDTLGEETVKDTAVKILNVFNILISKGSVSNVLKLCVMCHKYWSYVRKLHSGVIPEDQNDSSKKYMFEDQLLCLQVYLHKSSSYITEEVSRAAYTFRDIIVKNQLSINTSFQCISSLVSLSSVVTRVVPMYVGVFCNHNDDQWELFLHKVTSITKETVHRAVYSLRDIIVEKQLSKTTSFQGISSLVSLNSVLTRMVPMYTGIRPPETETEEIFCYDTSQLLSKETVRSIYMFRDIIIERKMFSSTLPSIINVLAVQFMIPRERAVLVFQSFIYVLKHFVMYEEGSEGESGDTNKCTNAGGWGGELLHSHHSSLLVAILDGLANLVRTFRITWRESVESLCLLTLAQQLLDSPNLSTKVGLTVQALQLIQLCIENFMPPNLALLTNSLSGTSFEQLGSIIYKRLHAPHWEVRDSSLEVLHVIASIADHKYPLFQELILENKLCELVVHLALNDAESYVCASATKCLSAMVRVNRIWDEELGDKELTSKMMGVLSGESEGVVRREATLLICEIYQHRKVSSDVLGTMYTTMANVVISDLHWEVKVNALNFWELVIGRHLTDQGMIDGVFPPVTFSKEHRKIVSLTPGVIQERLQKVLNELSKIGCLHVLLAAVSDEEDLEVVKKAAQIITSLSKILEEHGLLKKSNPSTPSTTSSMTSAGSPLSRFSNSVVNPKSFLDMDPRAMGFAMLDEGILSSGTVQDEVINSILDDRDINLLARVYQGTDAELPGRQGPETKMSKPTKPLVVLSPVDFIHQLETLHVNQIVTERTRWIADTGNDLSILLDDMLILRDVGTSDTDQERNAIDCY